MSTTRRDAVGGDGPMRAEAFDAPSLKERVEALEASVQALEASGEDEDEGADDEEADDEDEEEHVPPTLVEWAVRLISVLLLASLIGYVVQMGRQPTVPPRFEYDVMDAEIEQRGESWVVPVEITNAGNESVLELTISAELVNENSAVVDSAEITFPLFGPEEKEEVEFWFDEDPAEHELRFNVDSYVKP
jgi:uncharacterized protein (TIGR02588 family)